MNISDFIKLDRLEQIKILESNATYLARRVDPNGLHILFDCLGMYMEVSVSQTESNLACILVFEYDEILQEYLNQVNLRDVLSDLKISLSPS